MTEQSQPKGEKPELSQAETVPPMASEGSKDNCEEILKIIHRNGGLPVTINASRAVDEHPGDEFREIKGISRFIKESRVHFNRYKNVMDEILNCGLGDLGHQKKATIDRCEDAINTGPTAPGYSSTAPGYSSTASGAAPTAPAALSSTATGVSSTATGVSSTTSGDNGNQLLTHEERRLFRTGALFSSSKSYSILKYATEKYVRLYLGFDETEIGNPPGDVLPYIRLIESKLGHIDFKFEKSFQPLFVELIWNYWHEEGMLTHTMHAIARRFQNKRSHRDTDPLANFDLDPLRPLNNLVWGYIQDGINRLTPARRAFEYDHEYGLSLFAAGGAKLQTADSRSYFIAAFHNLLYKCSIFYKEADNLFKVPDAFPVLNALREVHLLLAEGAGNQFGDLPITARSEMLIEQYILSRPEIREFLGGRIMVPYDEPWMDRVDAMKSIQGWPGASVSYFRDLAVFGEEIVLSIRWISWSQVNNRDIAKEWALIFRNAVQRYLFCYQAVTGIDLSALEVAGGNDEKALMPAMLLGRKAQRDLTMRKR